MVERCLVFRCILHCLASGPPQVAFIESRIGELQKEDVVAVQRVLSGVKLGALVAADGEEVARALFLAWEGIGQLLAYIVEDGERQAVVAMQDLLPDLYSKTPPRSNLRATEIAWAYRLHCYKTACQCNYLLYLEEDVTTAVANAARLGVGNGNPHTSRTSIRGVPPKP